MTEPADPPAGIRWTSVARATLGFASLAAGLLHLALAVGSVPGLATGLAVVGAAEFLWGVLAVSRPGLPVPRVAIVGALVPPAAWVVLLMMGIEGPRLFPMLAATVLDLVVAVGVARGLRRTPGLESRRPAVGIAIAAALIAALTIPALIATEATARFVELPDPHEGEHG